MQETEQINTRTDGPDNTNGILNLFTTAAQTAGQVYGAISAQNNANKQAAATADATRAAAAPVISPTPVAKQAATAVAGAPASTWIKGVSNTVVIIGGVVLVAVLGMFFFRRK
jgi:hypothetical protein